MDKPAERSDTAVKQVLRARAADALASLGSDPEAGLASATAASRLLRDGPNDVPEQESHPLLRFLRKFWGASAWMVELIAILSFILHKNTDFAIALALLLLNAVLSALQEQRASTAVTALRKRLQVSGRVLRDRAWKLIEARDLVCGDVIRLRSGDFVPADAQVIAGQLDIDQSALTGESQEIPRAADDLLYSGSIVRHGEATAVVVATGVRTYYGRTTRLVQSAHPKLHIEEVITRVVRWLFLIVGVQVALAVAVAIPKGIPIVELLPLSLVLLMSAVPVALPVMFTVSMALGSIELGRRGVLVTRLSAAEDAANMDVLCADKTGTLTLNRLSWAGAVPQPGFTEEDVLRDGAAASNEANQDAIDMAFLRKAQQAHPQPQTGTILSFTPFSAKTRRTEAVIERDGRRLAVMKGALRTIAAAAGLDDAAIAALETKSNEHAKEGFRVIAVGRAEGDHSPRFVGLALLADAPRPDSRRLINELKALGIGVKMLTGDALGVAREIGGILGLADIVRAPELRTADAATARAMAQASGGFAEVYPEDKFLVVKSLQGAGHVVGMTGDGVNDAPALGQAEVGIAVCDATDVAKAAASVVLTTQGLSGIVDLVKNGRAIYQRVLTWVINKISRTILKSGFVVVAFFFTGKFVISALGMVLLVFMTDFVKIALSTDRVRPSLKPESWKIGRLVRTAVLLGLLMLAEALGLLAFSWRRFDLGQHPAQLQTFTFETLLFFALVSIVSIRERRFFWSSRPSLVLTVALLADACVGILIGLFGLADMKPLAPAQIGAVAAYAFVAGLLVNDVVKTALIGSDGSAAPHTA
jgi:plasma-membrane proton-efflux P-type ATPase